MVKNIPVDFTILVCFVVLIEGCQRLVYLLRFVKTGTCHISFSVGNRKLRNVLPNIGTCREVFGILSANIKRKTVKARKTDIPDETFSPSSVGTQKTASDSSDSRTHGVTILTWKVKFFSGKTIIFGMVRKVLFSIHMRTK